MLKTNEEVTNEGIEPHAVRALVVQALSWLVLHWTRALVLLGEREAREKAAVLGAAADAVAVCAGTVQPKDSRGHERTPLLVCAMTIDWIEGASLPDLLVALWAAWEDASRWPWWGVLVANGRAVGFGADLGLEDPRFAVRNIAAHAHATSTLVGELSEVGKGRAEEVPIAAALRIDLGQPARRLACCWTNAFWDRSRRFEPSPPPTIRTEGTLRHCLHLFACLTCAQVANVQGFYAVPVKDPSKEPFDPPSWLRVDGAEHDRGQAGAAAGAWSSPTKDTNDQGDDDAEGCL